MDAFSDVVGAVWVLFKLFWPLWVPMLLIFIVRVALKLYKNARLAKSGIAELDKLGGEDFENIWSFCFAS